jgi:hypothetical protein
MQLEGVSAPIEAPALVPAPVPTVDTLAPVPVPGHSFGCGIAALLHLSFSRNRFHAHTVVLDRSYCVCTSLRESSQRARERGRQPT